MEPITIAVLGIVVLIVLLAMGMNIGIAMFAVGFFGYMLIRDWGAAVGILKTVPFNQALNYSFTVIPLFVLMGQFAFHSGMSADLFDFANKWLGGPEGRPVHGNYNGLRGLFRHLRLHRCHGSNNGRCGSA